MYYSPDLKLEKAVKLIESMPGEEGELVRYCIEEKEAYIKTLHKEIEEFRNAIKFLSKYTR